MVPLTSAFLWKERKESMKIDLFDGFFMIRAGSFYFLSSVPHARICNRDQRNFNKKEFLTLGASLDITEQIKFIHN